MPANAAILPQTQDERLLAPGTRGPVLLISAGIGMHAFNDLAIAASIPVAYDALGALPLLPVAYALFFIGVVSGGVLSAHVRARLGARATALSAATLFLTGTLMTALARDGEVFAAGRALQGFSDGIVAALCYALITEMIPRAAVQRVFSVEAVVWALSAALGPPLGGMATEFVGWRAAMLICLPLALAFTVSAALLLPARARDAAALRRRVALLPVAMVLLGAAALSLPAALPEMPAAALALPAGLALIGLALARDSRAEVRFFPDRAFRAGQVGRATWVLLLMPVAHAVSSVFMALALREGFDLSTIWTGWIIVTMAMCWSLSAMVVARLPEAARDRGLRLSPLPQVLGAGLIAAGFGTGTLAAVIAGHALTGIAFGMAWGPANQFVMERTDEAEKARTASFMPTIQVTGFAIGAGLWGWIAAAGGLTGAIEAGDPAPVLGLMWGLAAAVALAAAVCAAGLRSADREG